MVLSRIFREISLNKSGKLNPAEKDHGRSAQVGLLIETIKSAQRSILGQLDVYQQRKHDAELENDRLLIALFATGVATANADENICASEISELGSYVDDLRMRSNKPHIVATFSALLNKPPSIEQVIGYINELTCPDLQLFEKLVEIVARGDGKFCCREKAFLDQFREEIGRTVAVPVVATMSSGKSTLINAMLGQDILPAENQACTATVFKVEDLDGLEETMIRKVDMDAGVSEWETSEPELLKKWNTEGVSEIEVLGDFPQIESGETHIVLYDTPGPNNSMNRSHGAITREILERSKYGCVLFILNAEQFGIDDEYDLLESVAKLCGETDQTIDVIFILNKFDSLDAENEDLLLFIDGVRDHLTKLGFVDPLIIPAMSRLALDLRRIIEAAGFTTECPLTNRAQRRVLNQIKLLDEYQARFVVSMGNSERAEQLLRSTLEHDPGSNLPESISISGESVEKKLIRSAMTLTGVPVLEYVLSKFIKKECQGDSDA